MRELSILIFGLFLVMSPLSFAQEEDLPTPSSEESEQEDDDKRSRANLRKAKEVFQLLRKAYRSERDQEKKERALHYGKQDSVLDPFSGLCVECQELTELTGQVNDILQRLPAEQTGQTRSRIDELVAVTAYTQMLDNNSNNIDCLNQTQVGLTPEFEEIQVDDSLIIYQGELDINRVQSFSLYGVDSLDRVVFLRGKDHDADKIIRVDLIKNQQPQITVYKLEDLPPSEIYSYKRDKVNSGLPYLGSEQRSFMSEAVTESATKRSQSSNNNSEKEEDDLRTMDVDYSSSGLPEKLTILDFKNKTRLSENLELESDIELSSEDQQMILSLSRRGLLKTAELKLEGKGDVEMAFDLSLPTGVTHSQILIGDAGLGLEMEMQHSSNSKTRLTHYRSSNTTGVEHNRSFGDHSTLGLRYLSEDSRDSVHLEYKVIF